MLSMVAKPMKGLGLVCLSAQAKATAALIDEQVILEAQAERTVEVLSQEPDLVYYEHAANGFG